METKKCIKCNEIKELNKDNFQFRNSTRKYRNVCNICYLSKRRAARNERMKGTKYAEEERKKVRDYNKKYYSENVDAMRIRASKYREKNPEKTRLAFKTYYNNNYDKIRKHRKQYREENTEYVAMRDKEYRRKSGPKSSKKYRTQHPDKVKAQYAEWLKKNPDYHKNYVRNKRIKDINFRIAANLRGRLRDAIKNNPKRGSAIKNLGCSIEYLIRYLESLFQSGMTWENYGKWHIDHIKPLSLFDLSNIEQLSDACYYTNLQPLWAKDNISKGNKYDE